MAGLIYIFAPPEPSVFSPARGGNVVYLNLSELTPPHNFLLVPRHSSMSNPEYSLQVSKMADLTEFFRNESTSTEEGKNQTTFMGQVAQHAILHKVLNSNEDTPSDVTTAVGATAMVSSSIRTALREWWKIIKDSMVSFCRGIKSKAKRFAHYVKKALHTMYEWMKDRKNDFVAWIKSLSKLDPSLNVEDVMPQCNPLDESFFIQSVGDFVDRDIADVERITDANDAYLIIMAHFMKRIPGWKQDIRNAALQVKLRHADEIKKILEARDVHFDACTLTMRSFIPGVVNSHAFNFAPQSDKSWLDYLSPSALVSTLTALASSVMIAIKSVTSFFDGLDVLSFSKALGDLVGSYNNVARSGLGEWVSWFVDKVVFVLTGYHWDTRIELEEKWNTHVEAVTKTLNLVTTTRNTTPLQLQVITNGMQELNMLFPLLAKCDSKLSSSRKGVLDHLRTLSAQYDVGAIPVERIKPVTILMAGDAGCGKTFTQNVIVQEVLARATDLIADLDPQSPDIANLKVLARSPTKFSYNCINGKTDYDDGYRNQPFVCFEELGTVNNQEQQRQWLGKFFAASDSEPYLLNMAFADKGKRYFNSPFVIATTNAVEDIAAINCLADETAIRRRIEFHLIVSYAGSDDFFEPEKVQFKFHDKALLVMANKKITPSPLLRRLLPELGSVFGINELCNAIAMVYVERLHKESKLTALRCTPVPRLNAVFSAVMGGSAPRDCFLTPYGKKAKATSVFTAGEKYARRMTVDRKIETAEQASKFIDIMKMRKSKGNAYTFVQLAYFRYCQLAGCEDTPSEYQKFLELSPFNVLVFDDGKGDVEAQVLGRLSKFKFAIHDNCLSATSASGHITFSLFVKSEIWNRLSIHFAETYKIKEEFDVADLFPRAECETPPEEGMWYKIQDKWNDFTSSFKFVPQMDLVIGSDNDWYEHDNLPKPEKVAPIKADSLVPRFCAAVVLLRERLPRIACHPATIHEAFHMLRKSASYGKGTTEFFDSIGPHNDELHFASLYTLATRNWAQLRSRFSDPTAKVCRSDMIMVVKAVSYTIGKLRAAKALTEERKSYYNGIEEDEMIKSCALAAYKHCTPYQLSAYRVELKKIGFAYTKDGTRLTMLDPEIIKRYKARVQKNKVRNGTVPPKPKRELTATEKQSRMNAKRSAAAEKRQVLRREKFVRTQRAHKYNDQIGDDANFTAPIPYLASKFKGVTITPQAKGPSFPSQIGAWFTATFAQRVVHSSGGNYTDPVSFMYHLGDYVLSNKNCENRDVLLLAFAHFTGTFLDHSRVTPYCALGRTDLSDIYMCGKPPYETLQKLFYEILRINGFSRLASSQISGHAFYGKKVTDDDALSVYNDEFVEAVCEDIHCRIVNGRCYQVDSKIAEQVVDFNVAELPNPTRITPVEGLGIGSLVGGIIGTIINIAIISGIIYGFVRLIQYLNKAEEAPAVDIDAAIKYAEANGYKLELTPQSGDSDPNRKPAKAQKAVMIGGEKVIEQSGGYNSIISSTVGNLYGIYVCTNPSNLDEATHIASMLFVAGRIALLPKHVYRAMLANKLGVWLCPVMPGRPSFFVARPMEQLKAVSDVVSYHENVLIDVDLIRMQYHKKIVNYFATDAESRSYQDGLMNGWAVRSVRQQGYYEQAPVTRMFRMTEDQPKAITNSGQIIAKHYDHYRSAVVGAAACGAPIFVEMGVSKSCIRAMHVAGTDKGGNGIGVPVTKEWIAACIDRYTSNFNPQSASATYAHIAFEEECPIGSWTLKPDGTYECAVITSATGGSTAFTPTEFTTHEFRGGSPVAPCHQGQVNYEMAEAKMHKRDGCAYPSPQAIAAVNEIAEIIADKFVSCPSSVYSDCHTISAEEALDKHPELTPCDPTTSRGVRLRHMKIDKKEILSYDNVPPIPEKRQAVVDLSDSMLADAAEGKFHRCISVAKLKDELLEKQFVEAGKCRLFHVVDFIDNLNLKRCVGDFVAKTGTSYLTGTQACGVNMRGSDARLIYSKFAGKRIEESDVSGFDFGVSALAMPVVSVLAHRSYPKRLDRTLFMWAVLAILNTIMFNMGIGKWRGLGNTSGNWLTTWLNTLMNTIYFCVAVYLLAIEFDEDPIACVLELLLKIYSDDNITCLDRPWYTATNLARMFMTHFKVELTATDKGVLRDRHLTIDQAEFLSRTFRFENGAVFCPLNEASLYAQLYYVRVPHIYRNCDDFKHKQLRINLANVALELYEYPKTRRDQMADEIFDFLERIGLPRAWFPYRYDEDLYYARISA